MQDESTSPSEISLRQQATSTTRCVWSFLFDPVDIAALVFFRILFAVIMLFYVWSYCSNGWVHFYYVKPPVHLTYFGFEWVRPWPDIGMHLHFYALGALAVCLLFGLMYRLCAVLFCLGFVYVFLIEKALYQNHYYLICLVSLLLIFIPAHRAFSLDALMRPSLRSDVAPAWTLWLLRLQIAIPYFYGGLAKLSGDWLGGQPMRIWLAKDSHLPLIGPFVADEWMVQLVTYFGLIFDLLIVPMLLWRRTRTIAYWFAVAFHLTNSVLWDIGIFPWFMIGATLLYYPPDWPRKLLGRPSVASASLSPANGRLSFGQKVTAALLGVYVTVQLLVPFRHHLYPGDVNWTEEGHHFAWHMLIREKDCPVRFYFRNLETGQTSVAPISRFLNYRQVTRMGKDADLIVYIAHFLADELRKRGHKKIDIRVLSLVSLNGRKPQLMVDPNVNLLTLKRTWKPQPWIIPLREPFRKNQWAVSIADWEEVLDIKPPFHEHDKGARAGHPKRWSTPMEARE